MDIKELLKKTPDEIQKTLAVKQTFKVTSEDIKKQLNPLEHDVFDATIRPKKNIIKPTGQKDSNGNDVTQTVKEEVNRIAIPFQKIIVKRAVGFLLGNNVKIKGYPETDTQKRLLEMVQKTWDDNKLDYFNRNMARTVMSQCEAAELWYLIQEPGAFWQSLWAKLKMGVGNSSAGKYRMRVKLLAPTLGDSLYPFYDETGDMVAFSRGYTVKENGKDVSRFDIFTADYIVKLVKTDAGWSIDGKIEANVMKKIPVIYYKQELPEWYDVQSMIDRLETLISNFGDTNDYFGAPMVFTQGAITGFASKGERGKVLSGEKGSDAKYLAWDNAPEAIKLEIETLIELIYTMTQTPNISFSQMKGLGNLSGIAIKLMFIDAHLKVENHTELFGEMFQRRLNFLKHVMGTIVDVSLINDVNTLEIEPVITPYLPRNIKEDIDTLVQATGKPVLSVKTALDYNPLATFPETELKQMDEEAQKDLENSQKQIAGTFNV